MGVLFFSFLFFSDTQSAQDPCAAGLTTEFSGYVLTSSLRCHGGKKGGAIKTYLRLYGYQGFPTRRLSENSARSEDCEKFRIKISASEENSGAI